MRVELSGFAVEIWPFALALLMMGLFVLRRRQYSMSYLICCFIFGIYSLFAIDKVFFPLLISGGFVDALRERPLMSNVNLIPLYFGPYGSLQSSLSTLFLNIILTIPFGFGINFIAPVRARHFFWIAPAVGLGIELAQLVITLLLRYPYRVVDIHDFLMNTLGVLIGYGAFRVFAWLYRVTTRRFQIEHVGLAAYVYDVSTRSAA